MSVPCKENKTWKTLFSSVSSFSKTPRNIALHIISTINLILFRNTCLRDKNQRPTHIKTWCWVCNHCFTGNDRRDLLFRISSLRQYTTFALWQIKILLIALRQGIWCVILKTKGRQTKPSLLQEREWSEGASETPLVLPGTVLFIHSSLISHQCKTPARFNAFPPSPSSTPDLLFWSRSVVTRVDLHTVH